MVQIKGIVLDVFDTVLVEKKKILARPYEYMLTQLCDPDPLATLLSERDLLLEQIVDFETYLTMHAPEFPQSRIENIVREAEVLLDYQIGCYGLRPEWDAFYHDVYQQGLKMCLGSNLSQPYKKTVCDKLPEVESKMFSCDIECAKPKAEFFELCCIEMGIKPSEAIMIGNSIKSDIDGANNAGFAMAFWAPPKGAQYTPEKYARYNGIQNLNEIFPRLKKAGLLPL